MMKNGGNIMLKRDKADKLYSIAVKRYHNEYPDKELDEKFLNRIWSSIYRVLNSEGEKVAEEFARNGKLW